MTDDPSPGRAGGLAGAQAQLKRAGWCVVPGMLPPEEAAVALDRLWAAAAESERRGVPTRMPVLDPNASNVRVFNLLALDAAFRDLIVRPAAIEMVKAVLGPAFLISNFTANIARPGSKSMALHSDQSLVVPEPWLAPWAVNVIWCLTDVRFENGATLYVPGSHRWRSRADVPLDARRRLRPFEAEAGAFIVMDGRLWHTSGANVTADQDRALLFGYYSAAFLRPQVNWNACLPAEVQAGLDPQTRAWLGLEAAANTGLAARLPYLEDQFAAGEAQG